MKIVKFLGFDKCPGSIYKDGTWIVGNIYGVVGENKKFGEINVLDEIDIEEGVIDDGFWEQAACFEVVEE